MHQAYREPSSSALLPSAQTDNASPAPADTPNTKPTRNAKPRIIRRKIPSTPAVAGISPIDFGLTEFQAENTAVCSSFAGDHIRPNRRNASRTEDQTDNQLDVTQQSGSVLDERHREEEIAGKDAIAFQRNPVARLTSQCVSPFLILVSSLFSPITSSVATSSVYSIH